MGATFRKVPLSQGLWALVDAEDFERVMRYKWTASLESRKRKFYAIRWATKEEHGAGKRFKIRMHRFILGLPPGPDGDCVDHLNSDSLDNRKENLEVVSHDENRKRLRSWKKKVEEPCL